MVPEASWSAARSERGSNLAQDESEDGDVSEAANVS
jgi:hypothetical protein